MTTLKLVGSVMLAACFCSQTEKPIGGADSRSSRETLATLTGEFIRGDGFVNQSLKVKPDGRFSFEWSADDGGYHRDSGTAEIVEGLLSLNTMKSETNREPGAFRHPKSHSIRWGKRLYLLSESEILPFCNAINLGLEPREGPFGRFYLRMSFSERGKAEGEAPKLGMIEGLPSLPRQWEPFLLKKPLAGKVVDDSKDARAQIDLGSHDGLREGMELLVEDEVGKPFGGRSYTIVKVIALKERRCTVQDKYRFFFDELRKGQKVSSRIPKRLIGGELTPYRW
jgi:hypothetical protein